MAPSQPVRYGVELELLGGQINRSRDRYATSCGWACGGVITAKNRIFSTFRDELRLAIIALLLLF